MKGRTLGRYELIERLGRGGMGEVWRARDPALRRDVAVKVLRHEGGEGGDKTLRDDFVRRFVREARAAASLKHPNVVAIHDVGVDEEPYIVMEWVEGASLRGFIGDASVPVAQRIEWLVEIARALAAAHQMGLVHRDVKPDNVMITKDGHAKVLDFGIAKAVGATDDAPVSREDAPKSFETQQGRVVGTPKYMAPEQLRGEAIDARVDQWAWACVAYELLTGSMPDRDEIAQPISLTMPEVPFDVAAAIVRARSHDPEKRFDSMRALLATFAAQPSGDHSSLTVEKRGPDAPTTTGAVRRSRSRVVLVALGSFALAAAAVFAEARTHFKKAEAVAPPPPACTLALLAESAPLGDLGVHFFATPEGQSGALSVAILRASSPNGNEEQLVTITAEGVTSRMPGGVPNANAGTPTSVFTVAERAESARHYAVYDQDGSSLLVIGRSVANDTVANVARILPFEEFRPRHVVGTLSPHTKPPTVAFLVTGETASPGAMAQRPTLALYGDRVHGMSVFTGEPGEDIRSVRMVAGDRSLAYAFLAGAKLYVGAFTLVSRIEQTLGPFGVTMPHDITEMLASRPARELGESSTMPGLAFDGDEVHVVWSELGHGRIHHVALSPSDDAGVRDESFDAPTSGALVWLRINAHVFSIAWMDGAHVWAGEGPSVSAAIRRATSLADSSTTAGPWLTDTPNGTMVAWVAGADNAVRRAILTCR
jgi:hypothetical protein